MISLLLMWKALAELKVISISDLKNKIQNIMDEYVDLDYAENEDDHGIFDKDCDDNKPNEDICKPGKHNWKHSVCMVCSVCGECTGYSISCLSSIRSNRKHGQ